jgi:hypothetical protein
MDGRHLVLVNPPTAETGIANSGPFFVHYGPTMYPTLYPTMDSSFFLYLLILTYI